MSVLRSSMIKDGGKSGQLGHFIVLKDFLQFGQMFLRLVRMYFLQRSHKTLPMVPQPLQEWGASKSKRPGNVVFFTIFGIMLLILLRN